MIENWYKFSDEYRAVFFGNDKARHFTIAPGETYSLPWLPPESNHKINFKDIKIKYEMWAKLIGRRKMKNKMSVEGERENTAIRFHPSRSSRVDNRGSSPNAGTSQSNGGKNG